MPPFKVVYPDFKCFHDRPFNWARTMRERKALTEDHIEELSLEEDAGSWCELPAKPATTRTLCLSVCLRLCFISTHRPRKARNAECQGKVR